MILNAGALSLPAPSFSKTGARTGDKAGAKAAVFAVFALAMGLGSARAQLAHNCPAVSNTEFKVNTLVARATGIDEPLKMALDMDAQGNVDVYWVERLGHVKKYTASTKAVSTIATLTFATGDYEGGVTGIVLDPGFKTNHYMYIHRSQGKEGAYTMRVARFKFDGTVLDPASEKVILEFPAQFSRMHTGGAMLFDNKGDMWITTGENQAGEEGTSNTNDLRGKVLRIHPIAFGDAQTPVPGVGTTYTVPTGNLFPAGTAKTRPEIYVMGARNPYSLSVDPVRKVVMWGDIGPDGKGLTEEHNITAVPGNFGYPYFAGNNILLQGTAPASKPMNTNPKNTGLQELPPAIPAVHSYQQEAAITGPIYRYDGYSKSTIKMPPHFDGLWFVTDFQTGQIDTISLNADATAIKAEGRVFSSIRLDRPVDFQQGPDGALYVINYAGWFGAASTTAILRIEYTGSCLPVLPTGLAPIERSLVRADGMSVDITGFDGAFTVIVGDLQGRTLGSYHAHGGSSFDLGAIVGHRAGLYTTRLVSAQGTAVRTVLLGAR